MVSQIFYQSARECSPELWAAEILVTALAAFQIVRAAGAIPFAVVRHPINPEAVVDAGAAEVIATGIDNLRERLLFLLVFGHACFATTKVRWNAESHGISWNAVGSNLRACAGVTSRARGGKLGVDARKDQPLCPG